MPLGRTTAVTMLRPEILPEGHDLEAPEELGELSRIEVGPEPASAPKSAESPR